MSDITYIQGVTQNNATITGSVSSSSDKNGGNFSSYLTTTTTLEEIFNRAAQTYGVDVNLLKAIAKQESDFNVNSTSHSGAQGLMQLMPGTAAELGVTDAYDPEQNVMGGAKYISSLLEKYNGEITLALAAYNAGSGNVAKYGGIPPFAETQNYVQKVMGYYTGGVTLPNETVTSTVPADSSSTTSSFQSPELAAALTSIAFGISIEQAQDAVAVADDIFTYEEYLQFIDLYLSFMAEEEGKENTAENNSQNQYYASQNIHYNNSILNLLSGINT